MALWKRRDALGRQRGLLFQGRVRGCGRIVGCLQDGGSSTCYSLGPLVLHDYRPWCDWNEGRLSWRDDDVLRLVVDLLGNYGIGSTRGGLVFVVVCHGVHIFTLVVHEVLVALVQTDLLVHRLVTWHTPCLGSVEVRYGFPFPLVEGLVSAEDNLVGCRG